MLRGCHLDVVGDLRRSSPTFRQWLSVDLNGDTQRSLHIPASCAHSFQAPMEPANTSYRIDRVHERSDDLTIAYDDPEVAVPWPLPVTAMSDSDRTAKPLRLFTAELWATRA
jgi:dTDP-4-dehydrorhamnose 3,5-epimerase